MFNSPPFFGPSPANGAQRRATDDHYDIPWEFKNRALAAVVGQQFQNKKRSEKAAEVPKERAENETGQFEQQNVRKRLSFPQAICNNALRKKLMGNGAGERAREQRKKAPDANSNGTAPGTVPANEQFQFIQKPTAATSFFDSPQMASLLPRAPPCFSPSSSASPSASSSSAESVSAIPQNVRPSVPSHRHGETPPRQTNERRQSPRKCKRPSAEQPNGTSSSCDAMANSKTQLRNYPMVEMPANAKAKEVTSLCQRRHYPSALEELDNLVHEKLDRCQSEQILSKMNLGAHLLRRRPDRNLALSFRAKEGVLHIKLEFHQGEWILGDGPRFPDIHEMLRAYRRKVLPVRGAEKIRLGVLLKPSDFPGGLLLL
ncbi:hypothetical protein niasHS_002148 [Heterodera schachtii]|uniref:SH2 domain-containing protein n=1 Tax=Heterodera schachtii TaxID=97005 RepID=A0ABD2KMH2_HETSC